MAVAPLKKDEYKEVEKWQDIQQQFAGYVAVAVIS